MNLFNLNFYFYVHDFTCIILLILFDVYYLLHRLNLWYILCYCCMLSYITQYYDKISHNKAELLHLSSLNKYIREIFIFFFI